MATPAAPPTDRLPIAEAATIAALAVVLKLAFLASVAGNPFVAGLTNDEAHHLVTAHDIVATGLVRPDAFYFAPLYPYLLAALLALFGEHLKLALALQAVVGGCHVGLVHILAWQVDRRPAVARLAALLALLYGPYWMYETLLLKTTLAAALMAAATLAMLRAASTARGRLWALAGLLLGVLSLLRGNTVVVAAVIALALVWATWRGRMLARHVAVWGLAVAAGILPATIHNLVAASDLVPTTAQGGVQFWIGNHAAATGSYVSLRPHRGLPEQERFDAFSIAEEAVGMPLYPSEVSAWWLARSLRWIRSAPLDWLALSATKLRLLHAHDEIVDTVDFRLYRRLSPQLWLLPLGFGPVLALALAGAWLGRQRLAAQPLFGVTLIGSVLSVALFFVFARYRLPFVSLYLVLAAGGIAGLVEAVVGRRWRALGGAVTAAAAAAILAALPVPATVSDPLVGVNTLGNIYQQLGRLDEARRCFSEIVAARAGDFRLRVNLAEVTALAGRPCRALDQLERTLPGFAAAAADGDLVAQTEALRVAGRTLELATACGDGRPVAAATALAARSAAVLAAEIRRGRLRPSDELAERIATVLAAADGLSRAPGSAAAADPATPPPAAHP